jgi:Mg-chelatase subunit ChlD
LAELESRVTPETEALEEQSKLYLMDSAMQYELGSEESGNNSLQEAIQTSPYSDDSTYKTPLEKVAAVIHDTADSDEIKNTSDYLETAYENAVPYYSEEQSGQTSEEKETTSIPEAYKNQAANYVSTAKAMINIGAIDASAFPKVTFRLQTAKAIDTDNPTLKITDCNLEITDYTIQEVPFDGARVALVCDTSGSMDGSVQSLQDAVSKYVASMEDKEQTSIIAFADGVKFNSGFQSSAAGLESYISQLNADGGTNIGSGVWQAVNELEKEQNVYKAIIVLTDGEDSSFSEESLNELQQKCENADITLYTIGLGADIQAEYLQQIASYGNGQFIYCNEVDQLEALYAFIHKQMQHNYEVTYEAQNQDWSERVLAVENETDGAYAQKHYTIAGTDSTSTDGAVITAIDTKKIYKKEAQVEFNLIGTGFTTDTAVSVSIQGNMARQTLETEYVDETHIRVIIPADVPVDTYEIEATADQSVYKDTIEIFDKLQTLVYGAYTFTAQTIEKTDSKTTLSGDVTINDFIHFRGTVTLDGNVDSDVQIRLQESNGSYIRCTDALPGLLGSMCGNVIYLPSMGSITLYNDTVHLYDLDNYTVEQFNLPSLNFAAIGIGASSVALYPHKISLNIASVSLNFPLQEEILEYANTLPFTLEANLEALIVPEGLRIKGKVDGTKSESLKFTVFSFYLSELGLEFDTWKHDYSFVMKVGTKDIIPMSESNDSADYGFDIGITSGNWDSFHIYADFTIEPPTLPGVTFSDFSIGLEGLSQEGQNSSFLNRLWHSSLVGSCEVGFCKLSDYIPQLDSIFGDLAVLTLSDTKASISLGEMGLSLETTAKLLGAVEVGNAQISVGKYEYSNYLLGIDAQESYGLYTSLSVGPKLDLAKFKLETQGTTELNLSNRYLGVWVKGTSDIDIDFFGHHSSQVDGNALMAFHNDFKQFTIMAKGTNLKKNKTDGFKITVATNLWESEITLY